MSKHTPGKWSVKREGAAVLIVAGKEELAFVARDIAEAKQNALLFAAAPDLLEAATRAWKTCMCRARKPCPTCIALDAAIKKAEGRK